MDWFPAEATDSTPLQSIQTGLGVHPASYQISTWVPSMEESSHRIKLTTHLHLAPIELYLHSPKWLKVWCLIKHSDNIFITKFLLHDAETQYAQYLYWFPFKCTWCDNLNPRMALWKQNLITCAPTAAVTFEILSLWSYALCETMVPLPETVLKIVFQNTS